MSIHGPGILFVRSRIAQSARGILDENTFLRWYDNEHIAEVVETSGISSAFRYIDPNTPSACGDQRNRKPFLTFYPLHDLSFTQSEEFRKINIRSDKLPGNGVVYDLADFDISYLGLTSKGEESVNYNDAAEYIITFGVRPANNNTLSSLAINSLLRQQNQVLSLFVGYIRTVTFELQYARTNAQSRKLKGLPAVDEPNSNPSTHLAIHEFISVPDPKVLHALSRSLQGIDVEIEAIIWKLARVHRKGNNAR